MDFMQFQRRMNFQDSPADCMSTAKQQLLYYNNLFLLKQRTSSHGTLFSNICGELGFNDFPIPYHTSLESNWTHLAELRVTQEADDSYQR